MATVTTKTGFFDNPAYYGNDGWTGQEYHRHMCLPREVLALYAAENNMSRTIFQDKTPIGCLTAERWSYFLEDAHRMIFDFYNDPRIQVQLFLKMLHKELIIHEQIKQEIEQHLHIGVGKVAYISGLLILAPYRQKGYGEVLAREIVPQLRKLGYEMIITDIVSPWSRKIIQDAGGYLHSSMKFQEFGISFPGASEIWYAFI